MTTKYLSDSRQQLVHLVVLPAVHGLNLWYAWSVARATAGHVPYVLVMLVNIGVTAVATFLLGRYVLGQAVNAVQVVGAALVVGGIVLLQHY